uniref:Uncharacterized protein n=1 Tax=Caenorhabditis tropicalis TaxID=1561998 RepID=A0A1I7TU60_9PELO
MITIDSLMKQQHPINGAGSGVDHSGIVGRGISHELPTAYVTSTPLPLAKAQQQHPLLHHTHSGPLHPNPVGGGQRMLSDEDKAETEKNAIISSLFEEIRLEATLFGSSDNIKQEATDDEPTALNESAPHVNKKLKKRKSELALEMTADDVDDILGESGPNSNFNPKNPFGGPSPSNISNGFADLGSPGSSSFTSNSQKSSPPLSKYSQNNQGQRNSPPTQGYSNMSPYMTPQMNSPLHPQLQQQNSVTSSPPVTMHSPGQVPEFKPTIINGVVMNPLAHHHHLPHHTRFLQHQQSAPNLRLNTPEEPPQQQQPQHPHQNLPYMMQGPPPQGPNRPFDRSLVDEFEMCVRSVLMASHRCYCRHVYRQLTAEVSELYARVAKNQVPKKAVKKIIAARQPATAGERIELERQFKCLADGLESRQSEQLYESILNFLYKMRVAIPDNY